MTPKLSNLDIPEIKSAAAEWALVSSQIEKITLHRFKPSKLHDTQGPFYAIIIWVSPEVDVNNAPWMELSECRVGEETLPKEQIREQYIAQDRKFDREKASKHPLYGLWNLFLELSAKESKERECLYSFYRDGFERSDPRFDWLVLLLNSGAEYIFDPGGIYDDLDNTDVGSAILFSRKAMLLQEDGTEPEKSKTWNELAKPRWYTGQWIVENKKIEGFQLFDLLNADVHAFTHDGLKVVDRDSLPKERANSSESYEQRARLAIGTEETGKVIGGGYNRRERSADEIMQDFRRQYDSQTKKIVNDPKGCKSISFTLDYNGIGRSLAIEEAKTFRYVAADVDKYFEHKDNQSPPLTSKEPQDESNPRKRSVQEDHQKTLNETENYFHYENGGWRVGFHGEKAVFKDYKYIRYISLLLEKPGRMIGALDLVHAVDSDTLEKKSIEQVLDEGLSVGKIHRDDEISNKKIKEFEILLADIEKETDPLVKKEMEAEYNNKIVKLKKLNALVNDEGKPASPPKKRKIDDPQRKNSQHSINKALNTAYLNFEKSNMKKLAEHLKKYIRTAGDYDFTYCDTETNWEIKL